MFTNVKKISLTTSLQLVLFTAFVALSIFAPIISHHYQPLSGTIVNTILFLTVIILGLKPALLISTLPSFIAYSVGLLPKPFLPLIPVIILSNMVLVTIFNRLYKKSYFLGSLSAVIIKFMVIFSGTILVAQIVLPAALLPKITAMFGWMQLATAVFGAITAYTIIKLANPNKF